jgi:hypothetical protein
VSKPTVRRKDITLTESRRELYDVELDGMRTDHTTSSWTAELYGALSTGEDVNMSRTAEHAGEALLLLTEVIQAEGWEIE